MRICKEKNLYLVEDAAQAPLSFYKCKNTCLGCNKDCKFFKMANAVGTFGDVGIFSFNEPKNIMTGEGGLIITNNETIAKKCRLIRNHGDAIVDDSMEDDQLMNVIGSNFRMTELHASIAYVQTKKYHKIHNIRKNNYEYLVKKILKYFSYYFTPQKITHPDSYFAYTAAFKWNYKKTGVHRNTITEALIAEGIPVFKGYQRLMCDHPMFTRKIAFGKNHFPWLGNEINYKKVDVSNARKLADHEFLGFLQLGYPNGKKDMDDIINAINKITNNIKFLRNYNNSKQELSIGR